MAWIVAVFAGSGLAGCVDPSATDAIGPDAVPAPFGGELATEARLPVPDFDFTQAIDPDHDGTPLGHSIPALHGGRHGLELVAYHPLTRATDAPHTPDVGYTGIDVWSTFACVTQFPGPGGFLVLDIADPASPRIVSGANSGMANQMCRFTDDGDYLLLGAYIGAAANPSGLPAPVGDAASVGVRVYDVKDKANPRFLFHDTQGAEDQSTHGVYTAKVGDTNYVFYSYSGQIFAIDPGASRLRLVSTLEKSFHDAWAGRHPVTGDWISIQGNGCNLVIYDINDPAHPVELDEWFSDDESAYDDACADHWRRPLAQTVGGRAYVVVVGAKMDGPSLPFTVLDFTDPGEIFEVSRWIIPGEPISPPPNFYTFGGTEYETWNGYVAAGIMHAGVWVFDIGSPERALSPVTIGYWQGVQTPWLAGGTTNKPAPFAPMVWTAAFDERGYILSPETGTGLYIFKFGATREA